jgi:Leucine-rich repeat (LRR) protein
MKNNTFANKKNRIIIRFVILFIALIISHISYSCLKKNNIPPVSNSLKKSNTPPVYSEIPDANFKAYLKTIVPLAFTPDNKFISNHPSVVSYDKRMTIIKKSITSLSGIEHFTSLKELDCRDNQLTTLDVNKNIALTNLNCGYNQLFTLDVSKNTNLTNLECYNNRLTTLDISKNMNLTRLNCGKNQLSTINFGKKNVLRSIYCNDNQFTNLDISINMNLTRLECNNNQLTTLDVSKNRSLTVLYCYSNKLTCLDVSNNNGLVFLSIDEAVKCCHPSIKAFCDRRGDLLDGFARIPPFTCP